MRSFGTVNEDIIGILYNRIIAPPWDSERSRLSVICQNYARCEYEFTIPSGAFVPEPKVSLNSVINLWFLHHLVVSQSDNQPFDSTVLC